MTLCMRTILVLISYYVRSCYKMKSTHTYVLVFPSANIQKTRCTFKYSYRAYILPQYYQHIMLPLDIMKDTVFQNQYIAVIIIFKFYQSYLCIFTLYNTGMLSVWPDAAICPQRCNIMAYPMHGGFFNGN